MENYLKVTFYEGNDIELKYNKYWINKSNVNLFINEEFDRDFCDHIYSEEENFKDCTKYIEENYPNAKLVKEGCYPTGWCYRIYEF